MSFTACLAHSPSILMEGALGERLKREFHLTFDQAVVMAGLVYTPEGRAALEQLWSQYAQTAQACRLPFLAATPTRRVNRERVEASGFDAAIARDNVAFLRQVQSRQSGEMYVGGLLGCRGDAYTGRGALDKAEAQAFHQWEAALFAQAGVDFLYAALMPTLAEAEGMALALEDKAPYLISFTIQINGCLIDGTPIAEAIQAIDGITKRRPVGYMANCVHPRIVYQALSQPKNRCEAVSQRFLGVQGNTSPLPYAQLDNAPDLLEEDPDQWAREMLKLRELAPLPILGGCCGTDGRHMQALAQGMARG